jgi:hypothetical protein
MGVKPYGYDKHQVDEVNLTQNYSTLNYAEFKSCDPHKSNDYISCKISKFVKNYYLSCTFNKIIDYIPLICTVYLKVKWSSDQFFPIKLNGPFITIGHSSRQYINYNIRDILLSEYIIEKISSHEVNGIISNDNKIIYSRETEYKYFLKRLQKLIERSRLYAEICGRPERLQRLGYFDID